MPKNVLRRDYVYARDCIVFIHPDEEVLEFFHKWLYRIIGDKSIDSLRKAMKNRFNFQPFQFCLEGELNKIHVKNYFAYRVQDKKVLNDCIYSPSS